MTAFAVVRNYCEIPDGQFKFVDAITSGLRRRIEIARRHAATRALNASTCVCPPDVDCGHEGRAEYLVWELRFTKLEYAADRVLMIALHSPWPEGFWAVVDRMEIGEDEVAA